MVTGQKLNLRQKSFVKEFIRDGNATRAVKEVYGYGDNNACAATGSRLLRNVNIQKEIRELLQSEGINLKLVFDSLKTNLVKGAGVQARASDSNRAAELLLKVAGAFEVAKHEALTQYNSFYVDLSLPVGEILRKRDKLRQFFGDILEGEATHPKIEN